MFRRILTYVLAGLALWGAKALIRDYVKSNHQEAQHGPAHPTPRD